MRPRGNLSGRVQNRLPLLVVKRLCAGLPAELLIVSPRFETPPAGMTFPLGKIKTLVGHSISPIQVKRYHLLR